MVCMHVLANSRFIENASTWSWLIPLFRHGVVTLILIQRRREEQQGMTSSGGAVGAWPEVEAGAARDGIQRQSCTSSSSGGGRSRRGPPPPTPIFSVTPAPDPVGSRMGKARRAAALGAWASGTAWTRMSDWRNHGSRLRRVGGGDAIGFNVCLPRRDL
jgi:hypothetical protein